MAYDEAANATVWALHLEKYPGLVVRVRKPGFAAVRLLARGDAALADRSGGVERRLAALADVFTALADSIDSWTLTNNGRPVPVTRAAVLARPPELLGDIAAAWRSRVLASARPTEQVRKDLDRKLEETRLALERDLPAEALDEPLADPDSAEGAAPELEAVSGA